MVKFSIYLNRRVFVMKILHICIMKSVYVEHNTCCNRGSFENREQTERKKNENSRFDLTVCLNDLLLIMFCFQSTVDHIHPTDI